MIWRRPLPCGLRMIAASRLLRYQYQRSLPSRRRRRFVLVAGGVEVAGVPVDVVAFDAILPVPCVRMAVRGLTRRDVRWLPMPSQNSQCRCFPKV